MNLKETIAEGIQQFAERAGASLTQEGDITFEVRFPGEDYPAIIGIEGFGTVLSYATFCGSLPDAELAPTLLQRNWGGVESTCFYFSVNVDEVPWLILETRQILYPGATSGGVASVLDFWRIQCLQAKESLKH